MLLDNVVSCRTIENDPGATARVIVVRRHSSVPGCGTMDARNAESGSDPDSALAKTETSAPCSLN